MTILCLGDDNLKMIGHQNCREHSPIAHFYRSVFECDEGIFIRSYRCARFATQMVAK